MEVFLQQLINGITLGSIYGLIAIGYTMVYGIIGMINFAHGEIYMIGAFVSLITLLALAAMVLPEADCATSRRSYRIGVLAASPVPGINALQLQSFLNNNQFFGLLNRLS